MYAYTALRGHGQADGGAFAAARPGAWVVWTRVVGVHRERAAATSLAVLLQEDVSLQHTSPADCEIDYGSIQTVPAQCQQVWQCDLGRDGGAVRITLPRVSP